MFFLFLCVFLLRTNSSLTDAENGLPKLKPFSLAVNGVGAGVKIQSTITTDLQSSNILAVTPMSSNGNFQLTVSSINNNSIKVNVINNGTVTDSSTITLRVCYK